MKPSPREQLEVVLSASQPIPASIDKAVELPRRVSVDDHAAFRESIAPKRRHDPIDDLVAELRKIELEHWREKK